MTSAEKYEAALLLARERFYLIRSETMPLGSDSGNTTVFRIAERGLDDINKILIEVHVPNDRD